MYCRSFCGPRREYLKSASPIDSRPRRPADLYRTQTDLKFRTRGRWVDPRIFPPAGVSLRGHPSGENSADRLSYGVLETKRRFFSGRFSRFAGSWVVPRISHQPAAGSGGAPSFGRPEFAVCRILRSLPPARPRDLGARYPRPPGWIRSRYLCFGARVCKFLRFVVIGLLVCLLRARLGGGSTQRGRGVCGGAREILRDIPARMDRS